MLSTVNLDHVGVDIILQCFLQVFPHGSQPLAMATPRCCQRFAHMRMAFGESKSRHFRAVEGQWQPSLTIKLDEHVARPLHGVEVALAQLLQHARVRAVLQVTWRICSPERHGCCWLTRAAQGSSRPSCLLYASRINAVKLNGTQQPQDLLQHPV